MATATLCPQMTAATEHGQEVLRLQSTAMSANVVFINIDWKASRHNKTLEANMMLLGWTIARVVRNMKPAMVCMCEVGEASIPLTEEQMQQVADRSMQAWRDAATDVQLHCMFEVGAPYMTIYIDGSVQCSCHRILEGIYNAQGLPRTAQTFLCCGPGGVTVDVINVHAPSGKRRLTDQQRQTLLTNLLQSNSKSMPGQTIGSARYCYRAWLLSDHRSDLGSPISLSATPVEHGCRLIPAVSLHRRLSLAPLLQSMAGN